MIQSLQSLAAKLMSCHSAVVAAVFPASSPPRRLVSALSSFHRAVASLFGAARCTFVVAAPVFWCIPLHRRRRASRRRHPSVPAYRRRRHSRHRHPSVQPSVAPSSPQPSSVVGPVVVSVRPLCRRSRHHRRRRRRRIVAALRPASRANMQDLVSRHSPSRRRRFHAVVWLWDNVCYTTLGNIWVTRL